MKFPVKISPDDNGEYLGTFPDIPEAVTSGEHVGGDGSEVAGVGRHCVAPVW